MLIKDQLVAQRALIQVQGVRQGDVELTVKTRRHRLNNACTIKFLICSNGSGHGASGTVYKCV